MTTLSLFGPADTFEEEPRDEPGADPARTQVLEGSEAERASWAGGLTLPVLAFAALVASPAIWQCLVRHALPLHTMLERYVLIAIGCLLVSEVVVRMLPRPGSGPAGSDAARTDAAEGTGARAVGGLAGPSTGVRAGRGGAGGGAGGGADAGERASGADPALTLLATQT